MTAVVEPTLIFLENFVSDPNGLWTELMARVVWDTRMRARKTASFGEPYNSSGVVYPEQPMPSALADVADAIGRRLGFRPNNCLLNLYEDGRSKMGFHSDSMEELAPGTGVAIVSLGAVRRLVYKLKADREVTCSYLLSPGSLLYMDDVVQRDWLHGVPSDPSVQDARISCTFRALCPEGP